MKSKNYFFTLIIFISVFFSCMNIQAKNTPATKNLDVVCENVSQISIINVGTTTAMVSWVSANTSNTWEIAVGVSTVTDPSTLVAISSDATTKELTELLVGTSYKVWVRSVCTNNEIGTWVGPVVFQTDCLPVSTFNENLDTTTLLQLPDCWGKILRGENLSIGAKIKTVAFTALSAPNSIEITNWMSSGVYDIILVSPNLSNLSNATHRFRFTSKGNATLQVGTVSNSSNSGIFTLYEEITSTTANTEHVIDFDLYEGTDTHIAIRVGETANNNYIYLDNLIWEPIPACPDVSAISVVATTPTTADLIWTSAGTETSWDVAIGPITATDPTTLTFENVLISDVSEQSYFTATNLLVQTTYKAWVRSVCGTDGVGTWIGPILFTTACEAITDFNENFDTTAVGALPNCWSKILRGDGLSPAAKVEVAEIPVVNSKSVNLSNFTSTGNYDIILVSPNVSSLPLGTHQLRFFAKFARTFEVGTLNSNTASAVFTIHESVTTINGLAEYIIDFTNYSGTDQYIGIRMRNNENVYTGISLDNLKWEAVPTCPEISAVNVPSVTESSAIIEWTATPLESSWDIVYSTTSDTDPSTLTPTNTLNIPFELTNLNDSTTYYVWVRAVCENGSGAWIGPVPFTTECPPVAEFIQNFDNVTTPTLPLCWSKILRGANLSQFAYINTSSSNVTAFPNFTSPNYVQMAAQGSQPTADIILVSAKVSTLITGTHRLKFDTYYPGALQIGTLNGNTKTAVFTPIQTVESGGFTGASHVINFNTYTGSDQYIGIRLVPDTNILPSVNIDNIVWEPIPACPDVTQVLVTSTSQTGATFTWNSGGTELAWQVAVAEATVSDPNLATAQAASATTLTVDGLTASTNYKVWVRSNCTSENGAWIGPVTFLTPCAAVDVPYIENFQSAAIPALPTCTTSQVTSVGSNDWVSHNGQVNFGFGTKALRYYDSMENANAWFFTRAINLVQGQTYSISYKKGTNSNFAWMGANLKVMYGTAPYAASMTTTLADHVDFYGMGVVETMTFSVPQSGVYYFSFNVYSNAYASSVFLDDIVIDAVLSTTSNDLTQFQYYPNPVTSVLNISYNENITSVVIYNLLGQEILRKDLNAQEVKIDLSGLTKGTYIAKIISGKISKTIKVIKN